MSSLRLGIMSVGVVCTLVAPFVQNISRIGWIVAAAGGFFVLVALRAALAIRKGWRRELVAAAVPGLTIALASVWEPTSLLPTLGFGLIAFSIYAERLDL